MPINPFQKSSGNPSGITTYGGAREQDVWNQFYPRTLQGGPSTSSTPPVVGATDSASNAVNQAAAAVQQATSTPSQGQYYAGVSMGAPAATPTSTVSGGGYGGSINPLLPPVVPRVTSPPTAEQIAARDTVRADLERRRKDYEASLPKPGPAPTKPPTQSDWWMNMIYNNPQSFRNTIIAMVGRAQPYAMPGYADLSGFGGGFDAAQNAINEYIKLYGHDPRTLTEEELTDMATIGGLHTL